MRSIPFFPAARKTAFVLCLLTCAVFVKTANAEVDFETLHGSDLGMGIGARAMSMGGAFTALADDATAVFWNPAGLSQLDGNQLFLSVDYPGKVSSAGVVYRSPMEAFTEKDVAIGLAVVNRLRFSGDSGDEIWDEYASTLLSLAMVDIDDDFSGEVHSRTMDIRFSLAFSLLEEKRLLLGFTYIHLD